MSAELLGVLLVLLGYLSGSVPFGLVLGKLFLGVDVRQVGSGNIGATNVARAGGKGMGVVVLLLDAAKAIAPILLARAVLADRPSAEVWTVAVAVAAFLGHLFPPWLGFRGGKGVATGLGIFLVLAPWAALAGVVAYLAVYLATRMSSAGSLCGTAVCAAATFVVHGPSSPVPWGGLVIAALVFLRHKDNIRRMVRGEEKKMRV
jgi:acyl phosphate:glycerol-3-phosphate acyltransferase